VLTLINQWLLSPEEARRRGAMVGRVYRLAAALAACWRWPTASGR